MNCAAWQPEGKKMDAYIYDSQGKRRGWRRTGHPLYLVWHATRFAERIGIPMPDEPTRRALLEVFLGPLRFSDDRYHAIDSLAKSSVGRSGRDLRNLVNAAVLSAVKRTSRPKDFALQESDFAL